MRPTAKLEQDVQRGPKRAIHLKTTEEHPESGQLVGRKVQASHFLLQGQAHLGVPLRQQTVRDIGA